MTIVRCQIHVLIAMAVFCACGTLARADQVSQSDSAADRPRLLLNGTWDFRLDPEKVGESQQWWSADVEYPHQIPVPGIWQAHGFGEPNGITRHNYEGVAWFRRTLVVPKDWSGQRIWLRFEGICNHGDVFLNGHKIGLVETFITPYEFDVTDQVVFGQENVLVCRVDSDGLWPPPEASKANNSMNWASNPAFYLGSYVGMMQFLVHAGGINSHVILEARPDPRIDEIVVRPDLDNKTVQASVRLTRHETAKPWDGQIVIQIRRMKASVVEATSEVSAHFDAGAATSSEALATIPLPQLHPWSPEDPFLYTVEAAVSCQGQHVDRQTIRTGFRQLLATPEGNFRLNGKPYYLRGVGYDSLEPITGVPVPDKQVYAERLRLLKQYGFNYIRLLAHTPLNELYEAADEEGMFMQTEGEWFSGPNLMPEPTGELFARQIPKMIREFGRHPSWYAFSCFNEASNAATDPVKHKYVQSAYKTFREMDPTRFFLASDSFSDEWPTDVISSRSTMDKANAPDSDPLAAAPVEVFQGRIDELALYPRALPPQAIAALAKSANDPAGYQRTVMELEPIAYWQFEEERTNLTCDTSKQPVAISPPSAAAPLVADTAGKVGHALVCGSTSVAVAGLSLAGRAEELVTQMQNAFSLSVWANPSTIPADTYGDLFSCGSVERGRGLILGYRGDGHIVVGRCSDNILISTGVLQTARWNHIVLTYDGHRVRLFINGTPDANVEAAFALAPRDLALGRLVQLGTRSAADYRCRPHVWHEFDNTYIAPLPDLDIEPRLTGVMTQGWVLEPHRRRLETYGLLSRYPELRQRSFDLYRNYVKWIFEDARRLPRLDGYAWWGTTNDIPAGVETDVSSLSVLDMFYKPEKFVFEEFRKFNRESVLMIDADIDCRVLASGESRPLNIALSHFGADPVRDGRLLWKITSDENVLQEGVLTPINAESAKITELGSIPLGPIECTKPMVIRLQADLESDACRQSNDWRFWVFPKMKQGIRAARLCNLTGEASIDHRYGTSGPASLAESDLVFAKRLTPEVLTYLGAGGRVILLAQDPERAADHRPKVIWQEDMAAEMATTQKRGFLTHPGTLGYWARWIRCNAQIVENHEALGDFPHQGFSDYQLMRLYGRMTPSVDLTPANSIARTKVCPIIWALDLAPWPEDASRFGVAMTRHAMLSECRIAQGRAILCTLYVLDGVKSGLPEAGYLLDCLVDYACSDRFEPSSPPFTMDEARQFFKCE